MNQRGCDPSAPLAERQSEVPRRGQEEQESSIRWAMASTHAPQSVPAPQHAATASTLLAPARTWASISRSVTERQMHRTMAYLRLTLILNFDSENTRPRRPVASAPAATDLPRAMTKP
jgi:hypothetical protein